MKRLNITLLERVAEEIATYENKSRFIADATIEKIDKDKKDKLDSLLAEGYKSENNADKLINKEWEAATLEGWPD